MSKRVPITVIIPTMNRPETLERTLTTYIAGDVVPDQFIIVDQTQDEEKRIIVEDLVAHFGGEYLYLSEPSLTVARNIGLKSALNEILVISDDDIDVYGNTISNIYEIMLRDDIALIAGIDDNMGHSKTNIGYLFGTKSFYKRKIGHITKSVLGRYPDVVTGEIRTEWAMGFFFVCRKSLLEEYNIRWDERLISYAYAEDLDFSYRYCKVANTIGMKCIINEKIHVRHMVSKEYRIPTKRSTYMYAIHRRYIADKNAYGSSFAIDWCDFWRIVERCIKREKPYELINAIRTAKQLKKDNYIGMEEIIKTI